VGIPIAEEYLSNARQNYKIVERPHIIVAGTLTIETVALAMTEFVKQVYPAIQQVLPQARVTIWGKGAPSSLLRVLQQYPEINYVSYVDDYIDFLSSAALYVFPQRCGSGIQTKIQQAMAMGIPVVTRSHILFALGALSGKHAIACDENMPMAQAITHLTQDIEQQALLGQEGTRFIRENYRLSVVGSKLEAAFQHAVEKHRRYNPH
jgi:glycosyltransferase involved in cell wall biosynthesis